MAASSSRAPRPPPSGRVTWKERCSRQSAWWKSWRAFRRSRLAWRSALGQQAAIYGRPALLLLRPLRGIGLGDLDGVEERTHVLLQRLIRLPQPPREDLQEVPEQLHRERRILAEQLVELLAREDE